VGERTNRSKSEKRVGKRDGGRQRKKKTIKRKVKETCWVEKAFKENREGT